MKGLVVVMLGALALGCGSSSSGGSSSGVTGSKRIDSLTDAEKTMICDWTAGKFGGYGHTMQAEGYYLLYGPPGDDGQFQVSTIGDLDDTHVGGLLAALTRVLTPKR